MFHLKAPAIFGSRWPWVLNLSFSFLHSEYDHQEAEREDQQPFKRCRQPLQHDSDQASHGSATDELDSILWYVCNVLLWYVCNATCLLVHVTVCVIKKGSLHLLIRF